MHCYFLNVFLNLFSLNKVEAKKKKKKVNGSAVTNVKKSKTNKKKIRHKLLKAANKEEGKPAGPNKPVRICSGLIC